MSGIAMITKKLLLGAAFALLAFGTANADVASIKKAIKVKFPDADQIDVNKTQYSSLYEVYADGQLFYTDEDATFFFLGNLIDAKTMENVTEKRKQKLTAIKFDTLPLELAIKSVKGNGKRKLVVFSDPDCPFCKRLEKELVSVTDVTIYTFLYPIASLHPDAGRKAKAVWCASDRTKAWDELMLKGTVPQAANCDNPIDEVQALGQKHRVTGTPTLVFTDGRVVPGAIQAAQLEKYLSGQEK
jgi:thiol:disulfide interchange protein DsbC